ncbi:MAG TPA: hypothetical protein VG228_00670 [Solirubrobacteraceae bacterium]|nr:hypothetical protein [Solirubrobacteraceae bacterium]
MQASDAAPSACRDAAPSACRATSTGATSWPRTRRCAADSASACGHLKGVGIGFTHETTEGYLSSLELTPGWRVENVDTPDGFAGALATAAAS